MPKTSTVTPLTGLSPRRVAQRAASIVTVCDANLQHLQSQLPQTRLTRIHGLGPQDPPTALANRQRHLVVGVGRLVEKKGFDLLLHALARMSTDIADVQGVIVGDGDQRPALEHWRPHWASTIGDVPGGLPQPRVAEWLRRAHVMAAPCRVGDDGNQDALPTVLLEAFGAGLPAVATPIAGIPEIIEHDSGGLVPRERRGGTRHRPHRGDDRRCDLVDNVGGRASEADRGEVRSRRNDLGPDRRVRSLSDTDCFKASRSVELMLRIAQVCKIEALRPAARRGLHSTCVASRPA